MEKPCCKSVAELLRQSPTREQNNVLLVAILVTSPLCYNSSLNIPLRFWQGTELHCQFLKIKYWKLGFFCTKIAAVSEKRRKHKENSARMHGSAPEKNSVWDWLGIHLDQDVQGHDGLSTSNSARPLGGITIH